MGYKKQCWPTFPTTSNVYRSDSAILTDQTVSIYNETVHGQSSYHYLYQSQLLRATTWMVRKRRVQSMFATETEGNTDERAHIVSTTQPDSGEKKEMGYDDVLLHLGEFGRYQKRIYFLLCLPTISCAFHKLAGVFLQAKVNHR
uniref:Uncharacterized protein n=1 Tax=Timema genevievae TaxID=629358 RepID=A0A7R9JSQ6_TIMGE|nr:unnamed protein product [Timema genevievae]